MGSGFGTPSPSQTLGRQLQPATGNIAITVGQSSVSFLQEYSPQREPMHTVQARDAGAAADEAHGASANLAAAAVAPPTAAAAQRPHVGEKKLDLHRPSGCSSSYLVDINSTAEATRTGGSGGGHGADSDLVSQLQSRAFVAQVVVTVIVNGFDACAALVFVFSVLKGVDVRVLRIIAVIGVVLGALSLARLAFIPPTLAAYAALAASRLNECDAESAAMVAQCRIDSSWRQLFNHIAVPDDEPDPQHHWCGYHYAICISGISNCISWCMPGSSMALLWGAARMMWFVAWQGLWLAMLAYGAPSLYYYSSDLPPSDTNIVLVLYICVYLSLPLCLHAVLLCCIWALKQTWPRFPKMLREVVHAADTLSLWYGFGVGTLPGVWSWQCLTDARPAVNLAGTVAQHQHDYHHLELIRVLNASIRPATTRLLLNAWAMLVVYSLTEWVRVLSLAFAAFLAVKWQASPHAGSNDPPFTMQAAMAALSLAVNYIKSVREKWQLLERGMQQMSYGGALVLLFEEWLKVKGWISEESGESVPVLLKHLHRQDLIANTMVARA